MGLPAHAIFVRWVLGFVCLVEPCRNGTKGTKRYKKRRFWWSNELRTLGCKDWIPGNFQAMVDPW